MMQRSLVLLAQELRSVRAFSTDLALRVERQFLKRSIRRYFAICYLLSPLPFLLHAARRFSR
jgi:hypothetical protein